MNRVHGKSGRNAKHINTKFIPGTIFKSYLGIRRMKFQVRVIYLAMWMVFLLVFVRVDFRFSLGDFIDVNEQVCGCMSCIMDPQEDPWFTEHYDSRVPKLMNRTNSNISTLTYNWWMVSMIKRVIS
ncbi:hypothetical protein AMELA_G00164510 [Ameiurus melas]|uniref:Uncharacterized protein n=1 Tax=Ameiurus melas TaxID=219545 RepID=A0A7J6AGF5_AMEME|nr:hypothetical protein AMELA_G00164510 [Ameiurus melas]